MGRRALGLGKLTVLCTVFIKVIKGPDESSSSAGNVLRHHWVQPYHFIPKGAETQTGCDSPEGLRHSGPGPGTWYTELRATVPEPASGQ